MVIDAMSIGAELHAVGETACEIPNELGTVKRNVKEKMRPTAFICLLVLFVGGLCGLRGQGFSSIVHDGGVPSDWDCNDGGLSANRIRFNLFLDADQHPYESSHFGDCEILWPAIATISSPARANDLR